MREIEFRGKDSTGLMNHDWFYGSLDTSFNEDFPRIICKDKWGNTMLITVAGETVGQYTGKKDKNKTKIFEGDIIKIQNKYIRYVVYSGVRCSFITIMYYDKLQSAEMIGLGEYEEYEIEVIGNIYDNPELLEVCDGR